MKNLWKRANGSTIAGRSSAIALGLVVLLLGLGAGSPAAADDCVALGGVDGVECVIGGVVPVAKSGAFTLDKTLRFTPGGRLNVAMPGIEITITAGDFIMENNTLISGNGNPNGAPIKVDLLDGDIDLQTGSTIQSNGTVSGGFIQLLTSAAHTANIDGVVESIGASSGQGGIQAPGGGPITIRAGCKLTISDTGIVRSRGLNPGADLVHLEGCVVEVFGLVESTGAGHAVPTNPANSCSDAPSNGPRRNPVTRPGKPQNSTGCVEIWAGTTLLIDSTGTHKGEVNADIGFTGGTQGRGWIDLLANGDITINDGPGNDRDFQAGQCTIHTTFAVHANGGLCQNTDDGGLILIQTYAGSVTASGQAIQADGQSDPAVFPGGTGGEIRVEAQLNVSITGDVFARGDFVGPGFGTGGKIGPTTSSIPPGPNPTPIRAFSGAVSWTSGIGDARPTGAAVTNAAQRGEINLQACLGVNTAGATFPTNGAAVLPYPVVLAAACAPAAPTVPPYVVGFPAGNCLAVCQQVGNKTGVKYNDLNMNGVRDPGEPGLNGWDIHLFGTTAAGVVVHEVFTTQTLPVLGDGAYTFTLEPGTYTVCEALKLNWTQTQPLAGSVPPPVGETLADCTTHTDGGTITPGPRGYTFTVVASETFANNDFGNFTTEVCPEDPIRAAKLTRVVDPLNPNHGVPVHQTVQEAYTAAAATGEVIGLFSKTTENVVLGGNKSLTITQCTNARVKAADDGLPVWKINTSGKLLIIGPDAVGGTVGWLVTTGGHELRGVRASGASQYGIQVVGNSNRVSWNSSNSNAGVGVGVSGDLNDLRGGTVAFNGTVGVHLDTSAGNNKLSGATIRNNGDNGIRVDGSNNTISSVKVYQNIGDGVEINGALNTLKSVVTNATQNQGAEFRLNTAVVNGGGNKAVSQSIPATRCTTFPNAGTVCD